MAEAKVLSGAGLRGQVAGQTALSTVGQAPPLCCVPKYIKIMAVPLAEKSN